MERLSDRWMFYCGLPAGMGVGVDDLKHIKDLIDAEEQGLLLRLPKGIEDIDKRVIEYSIIKAINLSRYGVDVDDKLKNATETAYALHNAYMKGTKDAVDKMDEYKTEIRNKAIDEFAERMKELDECGEISVFGFNRIVNKIAEKMKGE